MAGAERELEVLESIYNNGTRVRQRDLARVAGLSLGMTNAILKRLARKGWLAIRKVNNRNVLYAVTPAGAEEIARRSYRYFKRTIRNVVDYKEAIERLLADARRAGCDTVALVGRSDLDFIVEHVCAKLGMRFARGDTGEGDQGACLRVISERKRRPAGSGNGVGSAGDHGNGGPGPARPREEPVAYLRDILR
jgi:DNA-binding MarR family transcriptional regulator